MPWVLAFLRGTKVFARVDERGAFVVENGRVEIRYKPKDGRKYGARADNLTEVSGQILPEETCGPADAVADAKSKTAAKAGDASAGGAAAGGAAGGGAADGAAGEGGTSDGAAGAGDGAAKAKVAARAAPVRAKRATKAAKAAAGAETAADEPHVSSGTTAIHVYADGACSGNPGPAGLGVVVLDSESRIELSEYIGHGTNNIAELMAILRALQETADSERPLVIHTDSSYSIGVLQKGWKAKANQDLIAELREVLRGRRSTRLVYVPGHAGVKWNERADSLARAAVTSRSSTRHVVRASVAATPRA